MRSFPRICGVVEAGLVSLSFLPRRKGSVQGGAHNSALAQLLFRATISGLFACVMLLSVALVKLGIGGVPLRAVCSMAIIAITACVSPAMFVTIFIKNSVVILVISIMCVIGFFVSLFNPGDLSQIFRQIFEIHFQAVVGLFVGSIVLITCGKKYLVAIFVAVISLSAVFAAFQFVGLNFAWDVRISLEALQPRDLNPIDPEGSSWLRFRDRALGLSFSPVLLGSQICLAFAAIIALKINRSSLENSRFEVSYMIVAFIAVVTAAAAGNRSPILGLIIGILCYLVIVRPSMIAIMAILAVPVALAYSEIIELGAQTGLRVTRSDSSSENRAVLRALGMLLFIDRPLGYGLLFNSVNFGWIYWPKLFMYENAKSILIHPLHNYYLLILNKYGILSIGVFAYALKEIFKCKIVFIAFIPYAVHIFFHNDGPFQSDFFIWFIVPLFTLGQEARASTLAMPRSLKQG